MKLTNRKCDCQDKKKYSILLCRQLRRCCRNPKSLLYPFYGGKGLKCEFRKAKEIEELYTRDGVDQMNEPFLARRDEKGDFSRENCCFIDSKVTVKEFVNNVYGWNTVERI